MISKRTKINSIKSHYSFTAETPSPRVKPVPDRSRSEKKIISSKLDEGRSGDDYGDHFR